MESKENNVLVNGEKSRLVVVEQVMAEALKRQSLAQESIERVVQGIRPQLALLAKTLGPIINSSAIKTAMEMQIRINELMKPQMEIINNFINPPDHNFYVVPPVHTQQVISNNNDIDRLVEKLDELVEKLNESFDAPTELHKKRIQKIRGPYIKKLTLAKLKHNRLAAVINDDYRNHITADGSKRAWDLLFRVAKKEMPDTKKTIIDYFNSNKKCRLYSNNQYRVTKILRTADGYLAPAINLEVISEKAFQTRLNQSSNLA